MLIIPTAGQRGDSPQAAALIGGLEAVSDVIVDAAYDSGALCGKISNELRAEVLSRPTRPARSSPPSTPTYTPNATMLKTSSSGSSASVVSTCAARKLVPVSWTSSCSFQPSTGSGECRQGLGDWCRYVERAFCDSLTVSC